MIKKYSPEKLGLETIYTDEYFIPMRSYKESQNEYNEIEKSYLISNYGRVYSNTAKRLIKFKKRMVAINLTGITDSLSILKLVMYNFGNDKDNEIKCLYVIDESKPITINNLTRISPLRNILTKEQKEIIREELSKKKTIIDIIRDNNLPVNATRKYIYSNPNLPKNRRNPHPGLIKDPELSSKLESAIVNLSSKDISECSHLSHLFRDICNSLGIEYNINMYNTCYRFFYGLTSYVNIYKESSTTSRET